MAYCQICGRPLQEPVHTRCRTPDELDPPRFCSQCGRRLDVQVFPTGYRATCRSCDGVHPAHRTTS